MTVLVCLVIIFMLYYAKIQLFPLFCYHHLNKTPTILTLSTDNLSLLAFVYPFGL